MGLTILNSRIKLMEERFASLVRTFDDDFIFMVASEIGLDECIGYGDRQGSLKFDLTGLQLVSFCCALAACAEIRDNTAGRKAPAKETKTNRNTAARRKQRGQR